MEGAVKWATVIVAAMSVLGHAGSGNCNWTLMYSLASGAFPPANRRSFKFAWTQSEEMDLPMPKLQQQLGGGGCLVGMGDTET